MQLTITTCTSNTNYTTLELISRLISGTTAATITMMTKIIVKIRQISMVERVVAVQAPVSNSNNFPTFIVTPVLRLHMVLSQITILLEGCPHKKRQRVKSVEKEHKLEVVKNTILPI